MAQEVDISSTAEALLQILVAEESVESTAAGIVTVALRVVPSASSGAISVVTSRGHLSIEPADEIAGALERAQDELGQGPSLTCLKDGMPVKVGNIASDDRWPAYAQRATESGMNSLLCLPLRIGDEPSGTLSLFSRETSAFSDIDQAEGLLLATQAAVVVTNAQTRSEYLTKIGQLEEAIQSRDVIGTAKGILMAREGCSQDEAFDMLRVASQHLNRKLRDIAAEVVTEAQSKEVE